MSKKGDGPPWGVQWGVTSLQGIMASGISKEDKRRKVPGTGTRNRGITWGQHVCPLQPWKNKNRTRGITMTHLLIPSYHSITDLAKRGDLRSTSPYKGRLALLHPRQSPSHPPLPLLFLECLLLLSTYRTTLLWVSWTASSDHWLAITAKSICIFFSISFPLFSVLFIAWEICHSMWHKEWQGHIRSRHMSHHTWSHEGAGK